MKAVLWKDAKWPLFWQVEYTGPRGGKHRRYRRSWNATVKMLMRGRMPMQKASAWYSRKDGTERVFVFIDQEPEGLPDDAIMITEIEEDLSLFQRIMAPYWIMIGQGK